MAFEGVLNQHVIEAQVESLKNAGAVFTENLRAFLQSLDEFGKAIPRNKRRALLIGIMFCSSMLSACADPHEMVMPGPLGEEFALYATGIPPVGEAYAQQAASDAAAAEAENFSQQAESEGLKPYQVEATIYWRFPVTVQSGDLGIWDAFVRGAEEKGYKFEWLNETPEGVTEAVEIWRDGRLIELRSLKNVLETSPKIFPGDVLIHTFVTDESAANIQQTNGLSAENIHLE